MFPWRQHRRLSGFGQRMYGELVVSVRGGGAVAAK
jgi:hypothetical protein